MGTLLETSTGFLITALIVGMWFHVQNSALEAGLPPDSVTSDTVVAGDAHQTKGIHGFEP